MVVQVHGFEWAIYAERVMPAFASWLIDRDETAMHQLFERTRCALEEHFLPQPMQRLRIWPRARTFVESLPRGPHSRKEYVKLCSVEQFTALSDRYLHNHTPHLYQDSSAVRAVWGAIIEEYCLPWIHTKALEQSHKQTTSEEVGEHEQVVRGELVSLLNAAGLTELAQEVHEQTTDVERFEWEAEPDKQAEQVHDLSQSVEFDLYADEDDAEIGKPKGIILGSQPHILHLRGWLAGISIRAMALFEYLACGRRRMPFGYESGEPFGAYCGYLTPEEVWQLAAQLHKVQAPNSDEAEEDYKRFCREQNEQYPSFRLVDEVLPANAHDFLRAVRRAALHGSGLICSMD